MILVKELPGPFCVICEECRIFLFLDREEIMDKYGADVDAYDAIKHTAKDTIGCGRTSPETPLFQRCRLTGHHTRQQVDVLKKISPPIDPTILDVSSWEVIVAVCSECKHVAKVEKWVVKKVLGPHQPIRMIAKRLTCTSCKTKGAVQITTLKVDRGPR